MKTMRTWFVAAGLLALSATLLMPALALGQEPDPSEDRATSFHAVSGSAQEDVPGGTLLIAAYAVVLVALVGYVVYIGAIQQGTQREMARLEKLVTARRQADDDALAAKKA